MRVNIGVAAIGYAVRLSADVPECRVPVIREIVRDAVKNMDTAPSIMGWIAEGIAQTDKFTLHDKMAYDGDLIVIVQFADKLVYDSDFDRLILFADIDAWSAGN
jgi:hypothetical protein